MTDAQRVEAAALRFRAFFEELGTAFFEREDVLQQIALSLLCREHTLITGPPGTAKSALASAVFGRIVCEETGEPSMYARQITESTVQTDLIGPIDFKNLMETGRTTHFTDEGMLGAVHAFLDEVFDGRDMLLRSALNVLQERELKQGTQITRGRIECALMTTNRYIADVIGSARETLLAFVDRVAFIAFVPRGFARASNMNRVLERHVARASKTRLDALLTIQDLDALQALVDEVTVSLPICDAIGSLIATLHGDLNQAARSDPDFVPTRYLSTRTAVRSGKVLRAQAVYDRIFGDPERELQVLPRDLEHLRLHLLLGGPRLDEVDALLAHESDPNERRQLEIVRTEREIFDRCLARLKKVVVPPLRVERRADAPARGEKAGARGGAPSRPSDPLAELAVKAASEEPAALVAAVRELTPIASANGEHAERARALLERAVAALDRVALRASLAAAAEPGDDLVEAAERLAELAVSIEDDTVSLHGVSVRLRAQARELIVVAATHAAGATESDLMATETVGVASSRIQARLAVLERLDGLRRRIRTASAPAEHHDAAWDAAVGIAERDVAALWDAAFCARVRTLLSAEPAASLSSVLGGIAVELGWLGDASERLGALGGRPSEVKRLALGERLGDLIAARMAALAVVERDALHAEIGEVMAILRRFDLNLAIAPERWLAWCAEALLRSLEAPTPPPTHDHASYTSLRGREQRVPIALTLSEVAMRVTSEDGAGADAARDTATVATLVTLVPEGLRERAAQADISRIERAVGFLERWWEELCAGELTARQRLDAVVRSRLFEVLWDDLALARFALEVSLVERVFVSEARALAELRERIAALGARTREGARALLVERTDEAWTAAIAHPS